MQNSKPLDIQSYEKWLKKEHDVDLRLESNYYSSVSSQLYTVFQKSEFWNALTEQLGEIDQEYLVSTSYRLLTTHEIPEIDIKKFESFIHKTHRKNVLNNRNWPDPPPEGWYLPANWYEKINDIVRTIFTVKYLDGAEFFTKKLESLAERFDLQYKTDFEAKETGYYAAHFYLMQPCEVPARNWDTYQLVSHVEIQVTTQLQEVIRKLLHTYYEKRRLHSPVEDDTKKWQWNYRSDEFAANYLGHILHYLEGMIMEIRDQGEEKR